MKKGLVVLGVVLVVVFGIAGMFMSTYNKLVSADESIKALWAQVENVLQRRNDLIPNLVTTVKGYAKHEKELFENIANARAALAGARTVNDKIKASSQMDGFVGRLLAIAENYPQLQASANFRALMDELSGTENRIAVERMRFNEGVQQYNVMVRMFPGNIMAGMYGFKEKTAYLKADEKAKEVPKVEF